MRKIRKLLRNPKAFFNDSKLIKKITKKEIEKIAIFIGFSTWKKYIRNYFKEYEILFVDKNIDVKTLSSILIKYGKYDISVFIWGYKISDENVRLLKNKNIKINYVEDGFIRSVELGATKCPPLSLCIDNKAAYFDSTKKTALEDLLNNYNFEKDPSLIPRASSIISKIIENNISKYNSAPIKDVSKIYGKKDRYRVLVIGQVEDDASIKYGYKGHITNNDLVKLAAAENPTAQIIYKPHPDVLNGYRKYYSDPRDIANICLVLKENISLASAFQTIDHVYTITSLSGFEAILRGIKVTTLGDAFYSNWGLTDDRQNNIRKKRKLTKEQLFALAYIVYPKYYSALNGDLITIEEAIQLLLCDISEKRKKQAQEIQKKNIECNVYDKIKRLMLAGDFIKAEGVCYQQWNKKPWDIELVILMSQIYRKNHRYDSAIYICEALSYRVKNYRVLMELFYSLQERGDKSDKLKKILINAIELSPPNVYKARIELIKYIWGMYGVGPELLAHCGILNNQNITPVNRMLLAAIYCEAGRYLLAERQYLIAKESDKDILLKVQYFYLLEHLYSKGYIDNKLGLIISKISQKLKDGQSYFEYLIRKYYDSFAIVGNAPSEIGLNNGDAIDEKKLIIRFNAYSADYPESRDYGVKTDIWVKTGAYLDVPRRDFNSFKLVIISGYNPSHRNAMGVDLFLDVLDTKAQICCVPKRIYEELFLELGATPSAGLAIIYWIYKIIGPVNKKHVFGFSFGQQQKHNSEHYFVNKHKVEYSSHLWKSEAVLLNKYIKSN
ncbi:beta-3-deoxy-D-manno-oct-2-ulosonic acid transferase [Escherichia coli]|nr:beta-3-deoxy-D-manno-oct-2-ulosonic acid transferase [Escherichia coli]